MDHFIRVKPDDMRQIFMDILVRYDMSKHKAEECANIFTDNSVDGVYTHGVNRFRRFVKYIKKKYIDIHGEPVKENSFNGLEQWNGNLGPGPLNAVAATNRAVQLAEEHGIGCVALGNTNHWMRGGTYGRLAAGRECFFMAWTNTTGNMPAWEAADCRLGNNPFVFAAPAEPNPLVLDMAMTQYAWGKLEQGAPFGEKLPYAAGFDRQGQLTNDPAEVLRSMRPLPMGLWKGAGFSLLLDIAAAILSGGKASKDFRSLPGEYGVSQVFIAISTRHLENYPGIKTTIDKILEDYYQSIPVDPDSPILAPGDRVMRTRAENLQRGIPVRKQEWQAIMSL